MILDKKIQGTVITSCCRVEERKIIVACIYFVWGRDVMKKKKRYRLLVRIVVNRRGLGVACIYFACRSNVVERGKRYRLLVRIVVNKRGWEWRVFFCLVCGVGCIEKRYMLPYK